MPISLSSTNTPHDINQQIAQLKNLISNKQFDEASNLCITTINKRPHIDRAAWFHAVLDFVSCVSSFCESSAELNRFEIIRSFAIMEHLRLTAQSACLSDFFEMLAVLDDQIVKLLALDCSHHHRVIAELKLRLFFYLSVYLQRLGQKKKTEVNLNVIANKCYLRAAFVEVSVPTEDMLFSKFVWEYLYVDGLFLKLQSALLHRETENGPKAGLPVLFENLTRGGVFKNMQFQFNYLHSLNDELENKVIPANFADQIFSQLLERKPDDLNIILWYILRPASFKVKNIEDYDLALPESRLRAIVMTVRRILPNTSILSMSSELSQLDLIVFLLAICLSYLIRYMGYSDGLKDQSVKKSYCWPHLPLCLLNNRLLPSGMHRRFWMDVCTSIKSGSLVHQNNLQRYIDQLRFTRSHGNMSARLILRVARAISCLPVDLIPNEPEIYSVPIWEAGLEALMGDSEFLLSPSKQIRSYYRANSSEESLLFPTELNSNWWQGTHVDDCMYTLTQDQVWFMFAWCWLSAHWLKHPPEQVEVLINHLERLRHPQLPVEPNCSILAGKIAIKIADCHQNSDNLKPLFDSAIAILDSALKASQHLSNPDESRALLRSLSDEIVSLQEARCLSSTSAPTRDSVDLQSRDSLQTQNRPYFCEFPDGGLHFSENRPKHETPSCVSGIFINKNDLADGDRIVASALVTGAECDSHAQLLAQIMEHWMPSFGGFIRVLSETSVELAKIRCQNDEIARLLRETRDQLRSIVTDRQRHIRSSSPAPSPMTPSSDEVCGLYEAVREVVSVIRDLRPRMSNSVVHQTHLPQPTVMQWPARVSSLTTQQAALSQMPAPQTKHQMFPAKPLLLSQPLLHQRCT